MYMLSITSTGTNHENRMKNCDNNADSYFYAPSLNAATTSNDLFYPVSLPEVRKKW
jgi:hypothetical protein